MSHLFLSLFEDLVDLCSSLFLLNAFCHVIFLNGLRDGSWGVSHTLDCALEEAGYPTDGLSNYTE